MLPNTQAEPTEYLMSPDEVRQFLGLGRTSMYQLLATGAIPSVRIGRLRNVRRTDVDKFVEARLEQGKHGAA